jgi:drug/metabolite transporter superfamily protein YnfA
MLATGGLLAWARWLTREKNMPRTAAAMELTAGFALQGLTAALAIDFSTGSKNWPALVGLQTVLLVALAYALNNRLVLTHACVTAFVWFGGETGYVSGWGMYWLGMTYPMRFLGIGIVTLAVAWFHATAIPRYQSFTRVYAHFGGLVIHLSLWFLSVFGNYADSASWSDTAAERLGFTVLWAAVAAGCLLLGGRYGLAWLRGYGLTFLIINVYTFYFQFVVAHSAELWWIHLLFTGGTLLGLGFWLERRLRGDTHPAPA